MELLRKGKAPCINRSGSFFRIILASSFCLGDISLEIDHNTWKWTNVFLFYILKTFKMLKPTYCIMPLLTNDWIKCLFKGKNETFECILTLYILIWTGLHIIRSMHQRYLFFLASNQKLRDAEVSWLYFFLLTHTICLPPTMAIGKYLAPCQ